MAEFDLNRFLEAQERDYATAPTDLQTTEDKNADSNEGGNDERP